MSTLKTFQEKLETFYYHDVMIRNGDLMEMVKTRGIARTCRNWCLSPRTLRSARSFPGPTSTKSKNACRLLKPAANSLSWLAFLNLPSRSSAAPSPLTFANALTKMSTSSGSFVTPRTYCCNAARSASAAASPPFAPFVMKLSRNYDDVSQETVTYATLRFYLPRSHLRRRRSTQPRMAVFAAAPSIPCSLGPPAEDVFSLRTHFLGQVLSAATGSL